MKKSLFITIITVFHLFLSWPVHALQASGRYVLPDSLNANEGYRSDIIEDGDSEVALTLQYRPRSEYRNGYRAPLNDSLTPAFVTNQRSRIGLNYENSDFQSRIAFQDVRTWGEPFIKKDVSTFLLHEAWFEWAVTTGFSMKIGRQVLKYDDQRLLAASNWNNVGATHDLLLLKYHKPQYHIHLGLAYNNDQNRMSEAYFHYPANYYKTMQFLSASATFGQNLKLSFLEIADGRQQEGSDNTILYRTTLGLNGHYTGDAKNLLLSAKSYWQGGKSVEGTRINAWFLAFDASYKIDRFRLTLGGDYFSGDDALDTTDQVYNAFNNLYGSGHGYYGSMDYFRVIDKHTLGGGLRDLYAKLGYGLTEKTSLNLAYHHFALANRVIDPQHTGNELKVLSRELGSEVDFTLNHSFSKEFQVKMGYSLMFAKESMSVIKGGDHQRIANWGFVMLTFHPRIFVNQLNR
jgi:hypothetical protein